MAVCHKECESGYYFKLLSCWEECASGYSNFGVICRKGWRFYFKKSYLAKVLTNFNKEVACPEGMYKLGALCYRDCAQKQMFNCGMGACSLSKEGCYEGVLKITVDFVMGLGKFISFIAIKTDGTNVTEAKTKLEEAIKRVDQKFLQKAFENVKKWIGDNKLKAFFVDMMIKYTTNIIRSKVSKFLNDTMIAKICNRVHDEVSNQMQAATEPNIFFGIDVSKFEGVISECVKVDLFNNNPSDELMCVKKALETAAGLDVTGITAMAAAFMHPVCDI